MQLLAIGFLVTLGVCLALAAAPAIIAVLGALLWVGGVIVAVAVVFAIIWIVRNV